MAFLDELPLDILLIAVKWLCRNDRRDPVFYELLSVATVSTSLRRPLLPLLYRDLVSEFIYIKEDDAYHNSALANSAGCSEHVQRVTIIANDCSEPDDIIKVMRDDMDAGNQTKWPNLRSYAYIFDGDCRGSEDSLFCSDFIRQLEKELPKLRQASPVTCDVSSGISPLAYTPPSVSFLTQLTSLSLRCDSQGIAANYWPSIFAPTLVDLTLSLVNPESIWNAFYDGHESQTVVFARLKRLDIRFEHPLHWEESDELPPRLQYATSDELTKMSVWAAGAASGKPGCRVPLFPVLRTLRCENMAYNFHDFISRTQCHNSLVSLHVNNRCVYFDFDANLFKNLETVEFDVGLVSAGEESTGSVELYKSALASLLRAKTNLHRMEFMSPVRDTRFQVPPDIGCINLHSLILGVEVDFKSVLRLLSNLKHLVKLELNIDYDYMPNDNDGQEDAAEYINELLPFQADYPPASSTLRSFACRLHRPREHRCYTASYALELALHLPSLESMTLGMPYRTNVASYKALLDRLLQELSGTPHMNGGFLNAKVISRYSTSWRKHFY
ncbi:hypothetical protein GQ54DRAFT_87079 [Martensiomyces pterosporus]|nr:hypothetical protein GQ54DRAFT_87079 [Martensiomyces pterosporus]